MIRSSPTSFLCSALAVLALAGCANTGHRAPVEDRAPSPKPAAGASTPAAPGAATATPAADATAPKPLPGAENAGKPGYYTVKPGDTLIRVGLENGQNWRDIARWSGLENPNVIEVGQVLRVIPPAPAAPTADGTSVVARPVAPAGRVEGRPLDGKPGAPASAPVGGASAPAGTAAPPTVVTPSAPTPSGVGNSRDPDEDLNWAWPAAGPVATPFDEVRSRGVAITGKAGDPVMAAADGRVIYAGSGLRGYGNLVIIKHNNTFLTAYAHNQTLLVKEDQAVRRGQKIAEMGSSDAERVQLHFEIRRQGKPVDPTRLLPTR
jgi:lipoprotein NlpD